MHEIIFLRIGPKSIQIRISREETVDSILTCQQKGCLATGIISNKEIYSGGKVNRQLSETSEISNFYLLHSLGLCCKVSKKNLSTQRKNIKTIVSAAISPHAFPPPLRPLREPPKVQRPTHFAKIRCFPEKNILPLHSETKSNRLPSLPASGSTFLVVARGKPTFIGPHRAASGGRRTRYTRFPQEIRKENNHMLPQPRLSGHLRTGG